MKRWLITVPAAAVLTFGLFFGMQALIAMNDQEVPKPVPTSPIRIVKVERETPAAPDEPVKPHRPEPVDVPDSPLDPERKTTGIPTHTTVVPPTIGTSMTLKRGPIRPTSDGKATPLLRTEPRYPARLLRDGVEGWVTMHFSIDRSGKTKNVKVTKSQPAVVFDAAALEAVRKWKYQPKMVGGTAVEQHGMKVRLSFKVPK